MEIRQLQTFLSIVETNSFTKASETLGYAQSSVTAQIKKLEQYFGTALFERIGRNIFLTEYGHKLLPIAKEICRLNKKAIVDLCDEDPIQGTIRVATPESLCIKWFPSVYKKLNKQFPQIDLDLYTFDRNNFEELLQNDEVDLAFVITNEPIPEEFHVISSWALNMNLLVSPDHELAKRNAIPHEALNNQRFILTEDGCCYSQDIVHVVQQHDLKAKDLMTVNSVQFIRQLVISGYGIGYLPEFAVEDDLAMKRLVKLPWQGTGSVFTSNLIQHRDKWVSPRMKAFIETVKAAIDDEQLVIV